MAKASPMVRAFNAGEFSELLDGRVDLDRYPASLHSAVNFIAAPQGPAIARSGTAFMGAATRHGQVSVLRSFIFSDEQARVLEFSDNRIRFWDENGLQIYTPQSMTMTSADGDFIVFNSADLDANVGDEIVFSGFAASRSMNGETARVTAKAGALYTTDYPQRGGAVTASVARVYHVACPYTLAQRQNLRVVQSVDVMYLLCNGAAPRKLQRYGDYDWRLADVEFIDGPFMPINDTPTKLRPSATGNAIPNMTSNTAPSGEAAGSGNAPGLVDPTNDGAIYPVTRRRIYWPLPASQFYYAFDNNDETYWASNATQKGTLRYTPATPFVCDGYTIYCATDGQDPDFSDKDYSPGDWTFEGFDGTAWTVLDQQKDYVLYDGLKSAFFELDNDVAYQQYRIVVTKLTRNGQMEARIGRLTMRSTASRVFDITASSVIGINKDRGFLATDIGRQIRLRGSDGSWRYVTITARVSATVVTVRLEGEPFPDLMALKSWRLGYWSDTTGWPGAGDFFEDRLWLVGSNEFPDLFAASMSQDYEVFSQTDAQGAVLDDSAIVGRLNSRRLSRIRWMSSDSKGILLGTGSEEFTLSSGGDGALLATTAKARPATRRGSADVEPVRIDNQVLYVQRNGRTVREFAFVFEADGYKSPSMSQLASHLGMETFVEMEYAAEPHSIVWLRKGDGSLVGLTYNREENVVGWHRHDFSGGAVEAITVVPQSDQLQDALWMVIRRTVNGQTRRYVERLTRFWDFDTPLAEAHFVDSALRYQGAPTDRVYGLLHLEGHDVYGLIDGDPVGPIKVQNGALALPREGTNIIIGLGYDSEAILQRLENGAADGTSQGKTKRINNIVASVWRSYGGEVGVYNKEADGIVYERLEYPGRLDVFEDVELYTGMIGPLTPSLGYDQEGRLAFRRPKGSPLPFNIVAIMPQLTTQDR